MKRKERLLGEQNQPQAPLKCRDKKRGVASPTSNPPWAAFIIHDQKWLRFRSP